MQPVSLDGCRIPLPVLLPIAGMTGPPFSGTVPADVAVFGIGRELLSVILGAAPTLAIGCAADCLTALELRKLEDLLTVEATPFTHMNGVFSSGLCGWAEQRI
jgi:hypothetical protein